MPCPIAAVARKAVLQARADYRPKETIFETFSIGNVKVGEHNVDKASRLANRGHGNGSLWTMKNMLQRVYLAKNKGAVMVVAGSNAAQAINGDKDNTMDNNNDNNDNDKREGREANKQGGLGEEQRTNCKGYCCRKRS